MHASFAHDSAVEKQHSIEEGEATGIFVQQAERNIVIRTARTEEGAACLYTLFSRDCKSKQEMVEQELGAQASFTLSHGQLDSIFYRDQETREKSCLQRLTQPPSLSFKIYSQFKFQMMTTEDGDSDGGGLVDAHHGSSLLSPLYIHLLYILLCIHFACSRSFDHHLLLIHIILKETSLRERMNWSTQRNPSRRTFLYTQSNLQVVATFLFCSSQIEKKMF